MNTKLVGGLALGGLALWLLSRKSDGGGRIGPPTEPPVGPGGEEPVGPVEPPPPPPPANVKNYVGSGWNWTGTLRQAFPQAVSIGTALVALGYPIIFTPGDTPDTIPFNMISTHNMTVVREFQRDYNVASKAQTVDSPASPLALDTDGLVGKNTLRAIINARRWANTLNISWADLVALG